MILEHCSLSPRDLTLLKKGNYHTVDDIVLTPVQEIAKRCRTSPAEIMRITDAILDAVPLPDLLTLDTPGLIEDEKFTTGDEILDAALNGGIRTGMVWEIVGESSAGKTQLGLQLSLSVQLPLNQGGLEGCVCYLTTSAKLPTIRLEQIAEAREGFSPGMGHVHTIAIPTVDILHRVITTVFPSFVEQQVSKPGSRPVKLLVIDALAELFHSADKTSTLTLVERSKNLVSLSAGLHELAHKYRIAVVVLNEVVDRFARPNYSMSNEDDLLYEQQSRWFNTAEYFGDGSKDAALGLVWANQINTRIMLSRTLRRRYLQPEDFSKRQKVQSSAADQSEKLPASSEEAQPTLIRRLSVVFSNVCQPVALDYIVSVQGITILESSGQQAQGIPKKQIHNPADGKVEVQSRSVNKAPLQRVEDIDLASEDHLWDQLEPFDNLDWDALEQNLSQAIP